MSAPASRPIHPCVLSLTEGTRGAEHSTWAYLTHSPYDAQQRPRDACNNDSSSSSSSSADSCYPNLVTASASTINVYSFHPESGHLLLEHCFGNLSGSIVFLTTLSVPPPRRDDDDDNNNNNNNDHDTSLHHHLPPRDSLLVAFAGHSRLTVLHLADDEPDAPNRLTAVSLMDLAPILQEASMGAVTPLEQDAMVICNTQQQQPYQQYAYTSTYNNNNVQPWIGDMVRGNHSDRFPPTAVRGSNSGRLQVAVLLGGGVAVVVLELFYHHHQGPMAAGWMTKPDPFVLPLSSLSRHLPHAGPSSNGAAGASSLGSMTHTLSAAGSVMSTGFGDIISATFLQGYREPVLVVLHSDPVGRTWSGRLGRDPEPGSGAPPMYVTALSVSVDHHQAALLWSQAVPADSHTITSVPTGGSTATTTASTCGCVVISVNTLVFFQAGRVTQVLATNGWARATCPAALQARLKANPLLRLSVSLDGCALAWLSSHCAMVALRTGQLYVLQQTIADQWTLLPTGHTLGAIGEVEHLNALPLPLHTLWDNWVLKLDGTDNKNKVLQHHHYSVGLLFAGSRLGSSLLLGYGTEAVDIPRDVMIKNHPTGEQSGDMASLVKVEDEKQQPETNLSADVDDDYDRILRMEEDALYAPPSNHQQTEPHTVPPSDDEGDTPQSSRKLQKHEEEQQQRKRQRMSQFSVIKVLRPLDSLAHLGPLGPSCEGPVSRVPRYLLAENDAVVGAPQQSAPIVSAPAVIFPSGFGSSGGLAVATVPGRDDRMILAEEDCFNVDSIFSLPRMGIVLLAMSDKAGGGIRALRLQEPSTTRECHELKEVNVTAWSGGEEFSAAASVFESTLLQSVEVSATSFAVLTRTTMVGGSFTYVVAIFTERNEILELVHEHVIDGVENDAIVQVRSFTKANGDDSAVFVFGCTWSSGRASILSFDLNGISSSFTFDVPLAEEDPMETDEESEDVKVFYRLQRAVALDIFQAPRKFFQTHGKTLDPTRTEIRRRTTSGISSYFDDDDDELYTSTITPNSSRFNERQRQTTDNNSDEIVTFVALCRQSGVLEVYEYFFKSDIDQVKLHWSANGCGHGVQALQDHPHSAPGIRLPRSHMISAREITFFWCGPSVYGLNATVSSGRTFCLALETSSGDLELYTMDRQSRFSKGPTFRRHPLRCATRPSQEQIKYNTKLVRKGIAAKQTITESSFWYNILHPFCGLSGQDGLFVACTRPVWIVAERGRPTTILHRMRHAAPAGGKPRPLPGFCCVEITSNQKKVAALTLHERVGRVGSQRLTLLKGLSEVFASHGLLTGNGGLCVEKIPLGVTVRRIEFIDDTETSSGDHPLYAVLVSREIEADQSSWNSDGLTEEERKRQMEEKEAAKIKRQVEADLGGFDVDSEWVEEIEREDCFRIDQDLGGAPPVRKQAFSLWIVDAADKWNVVDSFELNEYEIALTLSVMRLSEFHEEPGSNSSAGAEEDLEKHLFLAVGTGTVDHNGEDVSSKGRVLLFQLKRPQDALRLSTSQVAELTLTYEKLIFHGPVTSLSCLSSEGRNRLVIGAGADVNIEQWGNGKLTQVGFFRATMQILDIRLFKVLLKTL